MGKKITVYNVAMEEGITRQGIIARAGNMFIQELKRQEKDHIITTIKQSEQWGNIKKEFWVASYPKAMKPAIVGYLNISKKLQRMHDVNKSKSRSGKPNRSRA